MTADPNMDDLSQVEHSELVHRVSRYLAVDIHDADDAAQDSWLAALSSAPHRITSLPGWMVSVTRRQVIRLRKSRLRRQEVEQLSYESKRSRSPLEELLEASDNGAVHLALGRLGRKYKEVIRLRYFEELSHDEISRRLELPIETVRTRLKRGLQALRRDFELEGRVHRGSWCLVMVELICADRRAGRTACASPGSAPGGLVAAKGLAAASTLAAAVFLCAGSIEAPAESAVAPLSNDSAEVVRSLGSPTSVALSEPELRTAIVDAQAGAVATETRLQVKLRHASDRSDVSGAQLHLVRLGFHRARARSQVTDFAGQAQFSFAESGQYLLSADLGGQRVLSLVAGQAEQVEWQLTGSSVAGRTLTKKGQPLPFADIWLYPQGDPKRGRVATQSDAEGHFALRGIPDTSMLGLAARGHVRSDLVRLRDATLGQGQAGARQLDLWAGVRARECIGTVRDSQGQPIPGARIWVHSPNANLGRQFNPQGGTTLSPPLSTAESDAGGRFQLEGVDGRVQVLRVHADGFVDQDVTAGRRALMPILDFAIVLQRGASLRGRLSGPDGMPMAGARLLAIATHNQSRATAISASDGCYALRGLAQGTHELFALVQRDDQSLRASVVIAVQKSEAVVWNPILRSGGSLTGRLLGMTHSSLAGLRLELTPEVISQASLELPIPPQWLDATGEFAFPVNEGIAYDLTLWSTESASTPMAHWSGLRPKDTGHLLSLSEALLAQGTLRGRMAQPLGKEQHLEVWSADLEVGHEISDRDGSGEFKLAGLLPGSYRLLLFSSHRAPISLITFEIERGQFLDLGILKAPASADLRIRLVGGDAEDLAKSGNLTVILSGEFGASSCIRLDHDDARRLQVSAREFVISSLAPGACLVSLSGQRAVWIQESINLEPGSEQVLEWDITPMKPTQMNLSFPVRINAEGSAGIIFRSEQGALRVRQAPLGQQESGEQITYNHGFQLEDGNWEVEVVCGNWHATLNFQMPCVEPLCVAAQLWVPMDRELATEPGGSSSLRMLRDYALAE